VERAKKGRQNNARHAGETHNNNSPAFGAPRFTCMGMTILRVKNTNVSFTLGKLTLLEAHGDIRA